MLAIACSALLGRATAIELACLDEHGKGPRMRWTGDPDGKVELDDIERDPEQAGNHLGVEFGDRQHVEGETALLRSACRCSPLLIMAGGEKLSHGWKAMFEAPSDADSTITPTAIRDEASSRSPISIWLATSPSGRSCATRRSSRC